MAKDDDSRTVMESAGVKFSDARKSEPVRLVWATEKEIVLAPAGQLTRGIKLDGGLVASVLYSK